MGDIGVCCLLKGELLNGDMGLFCDLIGERIGERGL